MAAIVPAARRGKDWPDSMRLAIDALCSFATTEPGLSSLLLVGAYAAGPVALVRRDEVTHGIEALFAPGYELHPKTAPVAAETAVAAINSLMYNQMTEGGGAESLPQIAPLATYIALVPFIGAEEAAAVANGEER